MGRSSSAVISFLTAGLFGLSFAVAAKPAAADDLSPGETPRQIPSLLNSLLTSQAEAAQALPERVIVGASVVLVIDVSASIDEEETTQMLDGIRGALRDEAGVDYSECYALTAVHFANRASVGKTHIVCRRETMERFIAEEIGADIGMMNRFYYGRGTNIGAGLQQAQTVFSMEKDVMNIYAQRRRVVIVGDGPSKDDPDLHHTVVSLAKRFGVTSYAIPIDDRGGQLTDSTRAYFRAQLVTPAGLTYVDREVFGEHPLPVQPGHYLPAPSFAEVQHSVVLALRGPGL